MFPEDRIVWLVIREQREDRVREAERYRLARQAIETEWIFDKLGMANGAKGKHLGRDVMRAIPGVFGWSGY